MIVISFLCFVTIVICHVLASSGNDGRSLRHAKSGPHPVTSLVTPSTVCPVNQQPTSWWFVSPSAAPSSTLTLSPTPITPSLTPTDNPTANPSPTASPSESSSPSLSSSPSPSPSPSSLTPSATPTPISSTTVNPTVTSTPSSSFVPSSSFLPSPNPSTSLFSVGLFSYSENTCTNLQTFPVVHNGVCSTVSLYTSRNIIAPFNVIVQCASNTVGSSWTFQLYNDALCTSSTGLQTGFGTGLTCSTYTFGDTLPLTQIFYEVNCGI